MLFKFFATITLIVATIFPFASTTTPSNTNVVQATDVVENYSSKNQITFRIDTFTPNKDVPPSIMLTVGVPYVDIFDIVPFSSFAFAKNYSLHILKAISKQGIPTNFYYLQFPVKHNAITFTFQTDNIEEDSEKIRDIVIEKSAKIGVLAIENPNFWAI